MKNSTCQECGHVFTGIHHHCHNCGAQMRSRPMRAVIIGLVCGLAATVILYIAQGYDVGLFNGPARANAAPSPQVIVKPSVITEEVPIPSPVAVPVYTTSAGTLERLVEDILIDVLGMRLNDPTLNPTVISVTKTSADSAINDYQIEICYRLTWHPAGAEVRQELLKNVGLITEKIFADPNLVQVTTLNLRPTLQLGDPYQPQNRREEAGGLLIIRRDVAERTDWRSIDNHGIEEMLQLEDKFWLHKYLNQ